MPHRASGSCHECCENSLVARSEQLKVRFFRRRGQVPSAGWAARGFPCRRPCASGSGWRPTAPRALWARSRRRAARSARCNLPSSGSRSSTSISGNVGFRFPFPCGEATRSPSADCEGLIFHISAAATRQTQDQRATRRACAKPCAAPRTNDGNG